MLIRKVKVYTSYMTMIVAVAAKDRIVLIADGKSTDTDTGEVKLDAEKMAEIAPHIVICVSGMYIDDPKRMIQQIKWNLCTSNKTLLPDVQQYIYDYIHSFVRTSPNDKKRAKLHVLLVGYYQDVPHILRMTSTRKGYENGSASATGTWRGAEKYLVKLLNLKKGQKDDYAKRGYDLAEELAESVMERAYTTTPDQIGGKSTMCHVFPETVVWKEPSSELLVIKG